MNRTVIAIYQKGMWIQVWNLDYEAAIREAIEAPELRKICFIEEGCKEPIYFTSIAGDSSSPDEFLSES